MAELTAETLFQDGLKAAEKNDFTTAAACYRQAAELGHIEAIFELGVCYLFGDGVAEDRPQGLALITRAKDGGNKTALAMLAKYYLSEAADDKAGIALIKEALNNGDQTVLDLLKQVCKAGAGIALVKTYRDELKKAAVTDDDALFCLLQFYMGIDEMSAIRFLEEMVALNCRSARYHLGMCYMDGVIVEKDEEKALSLLRGLGGNA
ncbi:MAG: SEL1-like repeat protein [Lentisphaeria bacterium]|nr:SEL1-like repeat protein [Lentisphaeria bacterium]